MFYISAPPLIAMTLILIFLSPMITFTFSLRNISSRHAFLYMLIRQLIFTFSHFDTPADDLALYFHSQLIFIYNSQAFHWDTDFSSLSTLTLYFRQNSHCFHFIYLYLSHFWHLSLYYFRLRWYLFSLHLFSFDFHVSHYAAHAAIFSLLRRDWAL
jgi:hypothetical protein